MKIILVLLVAAALALGFFLKDKTVDASSMGSFATSYEDMLQDMSLEDKWMFGAAIMVIQKEYQENFLAQIDGKTADELIVVADDILEKQGNGEILAKARPKEIIELDMDALKEATRNSQ